MSNTTWFLLFMGFVVALRIAELIVARSNEKWARGQGAVEYGQAHYPYIVALHTLFLISLLVEYFAIPGHAFYPALLAGYLLLMVVKVWTLASLGRYWNTKILRIPNAAFVKKGPYKYFRHPNYFIVVCEIILIPMVFGLWITAIVFTILNAVMLSVRIRVEEQVWKG